MAFFAQSPLIQKTANIVSKTAYYTQYMLFYTYLRITIKRGYFILVVVYSIPEKKRSIEPAWAYGMGGAKVTKAATDWRGLNRLLSMST